MAQYVKLEDVVEFIQDDNFNTLDTQERISKLNKLVKLVVYEDTSSEREQEGRWVKCSDRLPKESGHYLVTGDFKIPEVEDIWLAKFVKLHSDVQGWINSATKPSVKMWFDDSLKV